MDEERADLIANFVGITGATSQKAESYLKLADYDLPQAMELFFDMSGADLEAQPSNPPPLPARQSASNEPISLDDDTDDDDVREAVRVSSGSASQLPVSGATDYEDDEAMARRLQEEYYGSGSGAAGGAGGAVGPDDVRAPIARTTETLVGGPDDDDDVYMGGYSSRHRLPGRYSIS